MILLLSLNTATKMQIYIYTCAARLRYYYFISSDDFIVKNLGGVLFVCFFVDPRCYDKEIRCITLYFL